jgi:peptidoglycan hydrolase-like protein with peptidoglycan-binding domain
VAAPYRQAGLSLSERAANDPALVRALQHDLRSLGYLNRGIDGRFGPATTRAVRSLQFDLLWNDGSSIGKDGDAPVAIKSFNKDGVGGSAVSEVDGIVDEALAVCVDAMMADPRLPKLPKAIDPIAENRKALAAIMDADNDAPTPFVAALVVQESGARHFNVPPAGDDDSFVTVALDRNDPGEPDHITSRGYGIGQLTLFHHPPRPQEVERMIIDPGGSVQQVYATLREKFENFIIGPTGTADDRRAEHGLGALRACKYAPDDKRYLRDCRNCAAQARKLDITPGTPVHAGASISYQPDRHYSAAHYRNVPDRADFPCDWPYAVRRYNGGGSASFHYQARVLLNLLDPS